MTKPETETRGISADNARKVIAFVNDLLEDPNWGPAPDYEEAAKNAKRVYDEQVENYMYRSEGYEEHLENYKRLGLIVSSAPYIHLFLRIIDDLIDGDTPMEQDELVALLKGVALGIKGMEKEQEEAVQQILHLFEAGFENWGILPKRVEEARKLALYGMVHMLEDAIRSGEVEVVSEEKLREYLLHNTGSYFSLFYMALGMRERAFSVNENENDEDRLHAIDAELKALMQHLRLEDLENDWNDGIINIPSEVIAAAGINIDDDFETVFTNKVIREWALKMATEAKSTLLQVGIRGAIMLPFNWKAAVAIIGMSRKYWKIIKQVEQAYG